ncbi:hypothetical protein HXX76_003294 [Chlamydomonas incerta]|uniref:BTB domain-containing protein n=1 Tax=Chlamydomonas incerta TaxID=51695 RepID=A0A835TCR4_CHLIN|nr:hypothetical protein HXX76_003294 [Chlamydomonas incerta]|eukprot:KAG2441676.1 hypothetical protein HXX76_003294 [Chlamydomonas incerta]
MAADQLWSLAYVPPLATSQPQQLQRPEQAAASSASSTGGGGMLVYGTRTALYKLPLPLPPAGADGTVRPQPELLAGREGTHRRADGRGEQAMFYKIYGITVDATGLIYLIDKDPFATQSYLVCVTPDGGVSTRLHYLPINLLFPTILPNGYLAARTRDSGQMLLVAAGLQPVLPPLPAAAATAAASASAPPPRSLPGDLGALLDAAPDGTSDVTVRVGERRFHLHRAILAARCDYFRQRLAEGSFADGRMPCCGRDLDLPDTEPEAFALLLRWLYTGGVDVPPEKARGVVELADRLLLPELCDAAQAALLASVSAEGVVEALLWAAGCAEVRGAGRFGGLLEALNRWYVSHHDEVRRVAGASRARLAVEAPALHLELTDAAMDAAADRAAAAATGGERKRRHS